MEGLETCKYILMDLKRTDVCSPNAFGQHPSNEMRILVDKGLDLAARASTLQTQAGRPVKPLITVSRAQCTHLRPKATLLTGSASNVHHRLSNSGLCKHFV